MAFPCTKCGACCLKVRHVKPLLDLGWVGDDGVCSQYDRQKRLCQIYDERPMVCRIDEGRPVIFNREMWLEANLKACDVLHLELYGESREQSGECSHTLPFDKE